MNAPSIDTLERNQPLAEPSAHTIGTSLVAETVISTVRPLEYNGRSYTTDLPAGLDIFDDQPLTGSATIATASLRPSVFDDIPLGMFSVTGTIPTEDENCQPIQKAITRPIETYQTAKGKVITAESYGGYLEWTMQQDTGELMTALGYDIELAGGRKRIAAFPAPETVKRSAAALGVDIKFFAGGGSIPGRPYVKAFAGRQYAASIGNAMYYKHDIEDDHLTAMVLGGEPLKAALQTTAVAAAEQDDATVDAVALGIDRLTAALRGIVTIGSGFDGDEHGVEKGRAFFQGKAANLGISAEVANEIIATAQANARTYHMNVQELN